MQRFPITHRGAEQLKAELDQLKTVERPRVIAAIAEARAHGDLKENAEYHAARDEQGLIEAKIKKLESKLANAQVIDVTKLPHTGKVVFGVTVVLLNVENEQETRYQIVCEDEADLKTGKISVTSPIAKGLIGKHEGDEVTIRTPSGEVVYEILEVLYI